MTVVTAGGEARRGDPRERRAAQGAAALRDG